jgi:signal peptidase I
LDRVSSVTIVRAPDQGYASVGFTTTVEPVQMDRPVVLVETERAVDNPTEVGARRAPGVAVAVFQVAVNAVSTFVVIMVGCLTALVIVPQLAGYRSVVVASGSMEPSLSVADVVVTKPPPDALPVGAVIDFEHNGSSRVHRIVEVVPGGYRTKGDANPSIDSGVVSTPAIRGYGLMVVPLAGLPPWLAGDGRWPELVGLGIVLVVAGTLTNTAWMSCLDDRSQPRRPRRTRWNRS